MARAVVLDPGGKLLDTYDRRDERRALLTARAVSSSEVARESGGVDVRYRWPVGSTIWVDGRLALELRLDGWREVPPAPAPPLPSSAPEPAPAPNAGDAWGTE